MNSFKKGYEQKRGLNEVALTAVSNPIQSGAGWRLLGCKENKIKHLLSPPSNVQLLSNL